MFKDSQNWIQTIHTNGLWEQNPKEKQINIKING